MMRFTMPVLLFSSSISIERRVPKMGVEKEKIVTRETGLCFKRRPQTAYATAERAARYIKIAAALRSGIVTLPPKITPTRIIKMPPIIN